MNVKINNIPKKRKFNAELVNEYCTLISNSISHHIPNLYWETIIYNTNEIPVEFYDSQGYLPSYSNGNGSRSTCKYAAFNQDAMKDYTKFNTLRVNDDTSYYLLQDSHYSPLEASKYYITREAMSSLSSNQYPRILQVDLNYYIRTVYERYNGIIVQNFFIDIPRITYSMKAPYKYIRQLDLDITDDATPASHYYPSLPLYFRIESEPGINIGLYSLIIPKHICINGYYDHPIIIAYDGPDPYRNNFSGVRITNFDDSGSLDPQGAYYSATVSSPPIYLEMEYDFKGILYAPFSRVYINGPGQINGCIVAGDIVDNGWSSERTIYNTGNMNIPQLIGYTISQAPNGSSYITEYNNTQLKMTFDDFNLFDCYQFTSNLYELDKNETRLI